MSDPLSLIASVVTVLDSGTKCAKYLRRLVRDFRHAENELIALSNETNDLNTILAEVERISPSLAELPQTQVIDALFKLLHRARIKLNDLEALTHALTVCLPSGTRQINRIAWVKNKGTAKMLQEALKNMRQEIHGLLTITTA